MYVSRAHPYTVYRVFIDRYTNAGLSFNHTYVHIILIYTYSSSIHKKYKKKKEKR